MQILVEFGDNFARFESSTIGAEPLNPAGQHAQNREITFDYGFDIWT